MGTPYVVSSILQCNGTLRALQEVKSRRPGQSLKPLDSDVLWVMLGRGLAIDSSPGLERAALISSTSVR